MTARERLREYAINTGERYFLFPNRIYSDRMENVKMWTVVIHEPDCRFAKHRGDGSPDQGYFRDESGLRLLAERGFATESPATSRYADLIWQGCKVCGTVHREPELQALAHWEIEQRAEAKRRSVEHGKIEQAKFEAKQALERAIKDAQEAYYAEHFKDQIDRAMAQIETAVRAQWPIDNPEQAALLITQKES